MGLSLHVGKPLSRCRLFFGLLGFYPAMLPWHYRGTMEVQRKRNASTMEVYGWQPISDLIRDGKEEGIIAFNEATPPNPNRRSMV